MSVAQLRPLPPAEAIAAFERRGLKLDPTFSWQDAWETDHARMFTVAKSAGFDILRDVHDAMTAAVADGTTLRDFAARLRPVLEAKGWWGRKEVADPQTGEIREVQLGSPRRLRTVFETNMRVSYAEGHWARFERGKGARPYLRYVAILDGRERPAHRARHNLCLPVDHPYWDAWAPPCGWGCRCTLQSLSARDVDRMRGELRFEPPPDTYRTYTNRRTGEVSRVPDGIDPGWAYNPGRAGWEAARTAIAAKVAKAPPALVKAAAGVLTPPSSKPIAFGADVPEAFRAEVESAWSVVPDNVKARLSNAGLTLHAPERLIDVLPHLANERPRGWPEGSTWKQVDGVFSAGGRQIVVAHTSFDVDVQTWRSTGRAGSIFLHETGHGLDEVLGAGVRQLFSRVYDADVEAYRASGGTTGPNADQQYSYFLQQGSAGPSEMFAELFADVLGSPSNKRLPPLKVRFPQCALFMERLLKAL